MKSEKIFKFTIFSVIFTMILGVLLHFTYDWSEQNNIIAFFSAINESVWEHLKLLFFPMLLTTIIGYFYVGKDLNNYFCARMLGIVSAILFVTIFFYTYTGIIGESISAIDISSFFIAVIIGEYISYKTMKEGKECNTKLSIMILIILLICFVTFTYFTPKINYFKDPVSGKYGLESNNLEQ